MGKKGIEGRWEVRVKRRVKRLRAKRKLKRFSVRRRVMVKRRVRMLTVRRRVRRRVGVRVRASMRMKINAFELDSVQSKYVAECITPRHGFPAQKHDS